MSTPKKILWNAIDKDLAAWMERAAKDHPTWADFQNRWGMLLVLERRPEEALAVFDRCLEINPGYLWARVNRIQTQALLGETREADRALTAGIDLPPRLQAYVRTFLALMEEDPDSGDRHMASVENPTEFAPDWLRLSAALVHLRNPLKAERLWDQAVSGIQELQGVDIAPWDPVGTLRISSFLYGLHQLYMELSSAEARRGRHPRAESMAAVGLALWSDRSAYLNQRGFLAGLRGEDNLAVRHFLEAAVVDSEDSRPYIALAYHYSATDDLEHAREALGKAIERAPRYADLQYQMGLLHLADGRLEEALDALDQALAIHPSYTMARMERAEVLYQLKKWEESLENFREVLHSGLESSDIHLRIGQIEFNLGRIDIAFAAFQRAGEINGEEPLVQYFLGKIHQHRGERQAAQDAWSRFLSMEVDPEMRLEIELALTDEAA